jgi:hypothetical protein
LNIIKQKFRVLKVADDMKIEYASQQLQGPAGIWWCHHRNTLLENMVVVWDQFKEAFWGHYIPSGLMAIEHTEFMKLTQGDKSVTENLHAFINLSRYAPEFVNMEVKKITSFKRGLCPKLMQAMCNSKCATFNEFVNDTILQENVMLYMLLLRVMRNLMNPKHLRPILLWWLHLSIIRWAYQPDIIHIRKRVRSRGAVLRKESLRHR